MTETNNMGGSRRIRADERILTETERACYRVALYFTSVARRYTDGYNRDFPTCG